MNFPLCSSGRRASDTQQENIDVILRNLRDENICLRERVRTLENQLGYRVHALACFGLTTDEEIVFGLLSTGRAVSAEIIETALAAELDSCEPALAANRIGRLRGKLFAHNLLIENLRERGWRFAPDSLMRLRKMGAV